MKVLRSVFLDPEMDETLRQTAFRLKVSKGELIRTYLKLGMNSQLLNTKAKTVLEEDAGVPSKRTIRGAETSRKAG
jgi:VIT1/CCC1 family predicted Fe2+/Mn2+ transporter